MLSQRQILWVIVSRLLSATLVLLPAAIFRSQPLYFWGINSSLAGLLFISLCSSLYIAMALLMQRYHWQLYFQIAIDQWIITLLIYGSGEVYSPYTSLYLMVIGYASLLLGKKAGYATAAAATIFYVGLIDLSYFNLLVFLKGNVSIPEIHYQIGIVVIGFFSVAALSAVLSTRLKTARDELEAKIHSLADLQLFHFLTIESIRSGLITTDLSGKVHTANYYSGVLLEMSPNEIQEKQIGDLFFKEFQVWWQQVSQAICSESFRNEFWMTADSGRRKYLGFSISPLFNRTQESIGYVISFQDLTEIKRLQEQLYQQDRMSAIGRMAAAIAHEIRNPLASMHGAIQVLQKQSQWEEDNSRLMGIVLRESKRLNKIIEDFLAYAHPRPLQIAILELSELIMETISLLEMHPLCGQYHTIRFDPPSHGMHLQGDADMIRQVFWNLALNGLRAMPNGGVFQIYCTLCEPDSVQIEISDTGHGMNEEEKARIFEPFFSHSKGGLGIGMALVYSIVNLHKGNIQVESEENQGTKIILSFPRLQPV